MFACLNRSPFGRSSPAVHTQQSLARPKRANRMPSLTASLNDMIRTCWISNTRKKHWLISINTDWVKRRRSLGNTVRMFTFVIGGITTNKLAFFLFFLFFLRPFHRLSEIQKKKKTQQKKDFARTIYESKRTCLGPTAWHCFIHLAETHITSIETWNSISINVISSHVGQCWSHCQRVTTSHFQLRTDKRTYLAKPE